MRIKLCFTVALAAILASCGRPAVGGSEDAESRAGQKGAAQETAADRGAQAAIESVYTDVDLDACELLEASDEGGTAAFRCIGYQEIPVFITEGDLRFDVDVGVRNDNFQTPAAWNRLGEKMEWRLHDGAPVAVIIRFYLDGMPEDVAPGSSWLAIIKIGTDAAPGCTGAFVDATKYDNANELARDWADLEIPGLDCSGLSGGMIEPAAG